MLFDEPKPGFLQITYNQLIKYHFSLLVSHSKNVIRICESCRGLFVIFL
nr:MAG TPA: hypothetical protein [Caudoviricetes sp.]